jgi:hypothetical protein
MTATSRFDAVSAETLVRAFVPAFKIVRKRDSKLMRLTANVLFFVPGFMDQFSTTIGYTAYLTDYAATNIGVIFHEGRHALQAYKLSRPIMAILYLLPQVLGVVALAVSLTWLVVAAFFGWSWWQLPVAFGVLALAPIPAYFRMRFELDAYTVSLAVQFWSTGSIKLDYMDRIANNFTSSDYYFMWPFKHSVFAMVRKRVAFVASAHVLDDPYLAAIHTWMAERRLAKVGII